MSNILEKICADKRAHVNLRKREQSFTALDRQARGMPKTRGFADTLKKASDQKQTGLIAEIKKASPSAGFIRPSFSPVDLAKAYARGGASCLSVLTDGPYFQGRNQDLIEARAAVTLPVLRKDFMLDPWQIAESRAIGADCVLLIMAALDDSLAKELHAAAEDYGLDVLIEVHDRAELDRALKLLTGLLGFNNRNLKTLAINLDRSLELLKYAPRSRTLVSESGIKTKADVQHLKNAGIHCFLVGEALLKQTDLEGATRELLSA